MERGCNDSLFFSSRQRWAWGARCLSFVFFSCLLCSLIMGKRHNRVHPGHFATQQGTPFYPAGMSAADWSTLVFTLPRRKIAWVHPTKATFFQNCTLILDKYPVVSENDTLPPAISPAEITLRSRRGHQNTHLPALNIQCRAGIKDLPPALPHRLFPL